MRYITINFKSKISDLVPTFSSSFIQLISFLFWSLLICLTLGIRAWCGYHFRLPPAVFSSCKLILFGSDFRTTKTPLFSSVFRYILTAVPFFLSGSARFPPWTEIYSFFLIHYRQHHQLPPIGSSLNQLFIFCFGCSVSDLVLLYFCSVKRHLVASFFPFCSACFDCWYSSISFTTIAAVICCVFTVCSVLFLCVEDQT